MRDGNLPIIKIGKYCSIARNCTFVMSHHKYHCVTTSPWPTSPTDPPGNKSSFSRGHITIGHDVWIGANVTIMDGLSIGDGAVVSAGAVVTKDVPGYTIVGGNPAKPIKARFSEQQIADLQSMQWWDIPEDKRPNIYTEDVDEFIAQVKLLSS
jgi:acetyltransferase-like isoleucine patch superfamily enzyme